MPTNKFSLIEIAKQIQKVELATQLSPNEKKEHERKIFLQACKQNFVIARQVSKVSPVQVVLES